MSTGLCVTAYTLTKHSNAPRSDECSDNSKMEVSTRKINIKDSSTLTKVGHFVNGVLSNTGMIAFMQPVFTIKTYRMNGLNIPPLSKLYNGMTANCISGGPAEGIAFLSEGVFSWYLKSDRSSELQNFTVSSVSGSLGAPLNAACERIMIQQQLYAKSIVAIIQADLSKPDLLKRLFKGTVPTIGRDAIYNIGIFAMHDWVKKRLKHRVSNETILSTASSVISGGCAGVLSTPFDLIKTKMQSDTGDRFKSMTQTAKHIIEEHGPSELFKGAGIRSALIAGALCVICFIKEKIPAFFPESLHKNSNENNH